jgi:flagellar biosynthesis protein FlhG
MFSTPRKDNGRSPRPARSAPGAIIAVASGKGGVGKTFLSSTLSFAFSYQGHRTLLFDGDFGLANVDIQLGISPQHDLAAVVSGWVDLADAVHPVNGGSSANGGFDVLPGASGKGALAELHPDEVSRLVSGLSALSLHYDRIIVDVAAGIDPNVMRLVMGCDDVLIVTNDEPPAMTDAYAFTKVLRQHRPGFEPRLIINEADKRSTARKTYEALARASQAYLGFRPALAGVVSLDPAVPEAIRKQQPLPIRSPQSAAWDDVRRMAESLVQPRG